MLPKQIVLNTFSVLNWYQRVQKAKFLHRSWDLLKCQGNLLARASHSQGTWSTFEINFSRPCLLKARCVNNPLF